MTREIIERDTIEAVPAQEAEEVFTLELLNEQGARRRVVLPPGTQAAAFLTAPDHCEPGETLLQVLRGSQP